MKTIASIAAASAFAVLAASPALAGWDRSRAWDPAFDSSYDRQVEIASERLATPATGGSAVATNDSVRLGTPARLAPKHYFGPNVDRFVDSIDSPYDN